jgi:hypothetical protein
MRAARIVVGVAALLAAGCFGTLTRTRLPEGPVSEDQVSWTGPLESEIQGGFDSVSGNLVVQVRGSYRAGSPPAVEGVVEECRTVSGASLLTGEILGGLGAAVGGPLLGVGIYGASSGCEDGGCLGEALGETAAGAIVLALSATLLGASIAIDVAYDSDEPFDCVEGERVPVNLPAPPDRWQPVTNYAAVAPGSTPESPELVPADDQGHIELPANLYLGCPERCIVPVEDRDALAVHPDVRPFLEEVAVEVPLILLLDNGGPGEPLGSQRYRVPCVRFADLAETMAGRAAETASADEYVRVRAVTIDAAGQAVAGATVHLVRRPAESDAQPAADRPWLALAPEGAAVFDKAFWRAVGERWRAAAGEGAVAATGEGTALSGADGVAVFLVRPGSTASLTAEASGGYRAAASVEVPAAGATAEIRLVPAAQP